MWASHPGTPAWGQRWTPDPGPALQEGHTSYLPAPGYLAGCLCPGGLVSTQRDGKLPAGRATAGPTSEAPLLPVESNLPSPPPRLKGPQELLAGGEASCPQLQGLRGTSAPPPAQQADPLALGGWLVPTPKAGEQRVGTAGVRGGQLWDLMELRPGCGGATPALFSGGSS